jgi:hypothetical protein
MPESFMVCSHCGRPSHLWGGESCDACDRDNNGVRDVEEPVGIGPGVSRLLFPVEEKGFVLLGEARQSAAIPKESLACLANPVIYARLLKVFERRRAA